MGTNTLQADSDLGNRAKSGAEDGIRTHDPLLGKWVAPCIRVSHHVSNRG